MGCKYSTAANVAWHLMIVAMDLNASPVPEEDEDIFERHIEQYIQPEERIETAVDIARRVGFLPLL